jgi:pimeloyl-ACP methyl ester carboxylesterase
MMAPRGFDSTLQSWEHGKWNDMNAIAALSKHFTTVAYDRRESGKTGGRLEVLTWKVFAQHAKLLLERLEIEKAYVLGVCMGVGVATEFANLYPDACSGLILAQPVAGHRWKNRMHTFFNRHIDYVRKNGLEEVRTRSKGKSFMSDPEAGPWSSAVAIDEGFAEKVVRYDIKKYLSIVEESRDTLFPDTFVSGPRPEVLTTIDTSASIWPGDDASHSMAGAHQLRELMPRMEFWDLHPTKQTAANMLEKMLSFKSAVEAGGLPSSPTIASPPMPPLP